ncbi:hypothetical protein [Xanthobacter versatilis]|uniref:Uncharacterized protein n=1 Tax=Xanthobacter autotrophicus (strain ATCC BAA-1158 / Py2) TaxID=78245 RepID=A7II21_XANP2|nr:hypothetical protein Xaut_2422 [Xanthobacter autotrophicus Py2]
MRHLIIAAVSALALTSTAALAQENGQNTSREAPRAYAPATHQNTRAAQPFNSLSEKNDQHAITEQDRLFLEQGDRGLGNG